MGLDVSKSRFRLIYASQSLKVSNFLPTGLGVSDFLFLSVRLVFRSRIFSELIGI